MLYNPNSIDSNANNYNNDNNYKFYKNNLIEVRIMD